MSPVVLIQVEVAQMSHPLLFPGITYFYPVGNTSAVQLTEYIPPEQEANILLLACGDPRHILYTVCTNEANSGIEPRKLDVTCCDVEAAVLARNAVLFTFLADDGAQDRMDLIWNIFYHFMLDQESLSLLTEQCRRLVTLAKDLETWNAGPYARFLTVCDRRTLAELHRLWSLYVATADYTPDRRKWFNKNFSDGMKEVNDRHGDGSVITSSRSAGPLLPFSVGAVGKQFRKFWSTGITDDGLHSTDRATLVNPTFAFSLAGEKFAVHYGVDPVAGFHLAEAFTTSHGETDDVLVQKLVRVARDQFSRWCTSVMKLLATSFTSPKLVIRMFAGDALRLCQAFSHLNSSSAIVTPICSSPWRASRIKFEESQYGRGASTPAPTRFNVIDTSNISDHVGLLNLLVATVPILFKSPSATLYTESLLSYNDTPLENVLKRLGGDMQMMSLLLGIVPSAFLSRFTTRSNVQESFVEFFDGLQYHQQIAWKTLGGEYLISFTPDQLGKLLFEIYLKMFSEENLVRQMQTMSTSPTRSFLEMTLVHYTRRSFVQLLSHIKSRVDTNWTRVMEIFDDKVVRDNSLILGSNLYQEMCCHFHLLDIVTFTSMESSYIRGLRTQSQTTLFKDWDSIPAVVTVTLVVPRSKITNVESALRQAGTPVLQCDIRNANFWNIFMDLHATYGTLEVTGTGQMKTATIAEEKEGNRSSPLIVYFSAPSSSLLLSLDAIVGFRTRPSPRTRPSLMEAIFTTPLENSRYVHILAEPPFPSTSLPVVRDAPTQLGEVDKRVFSVTMDESRGEIRSFVIRVDITDPASQALLAAGSSVKLEQTPTQQTLLCMDKYAEKISFPLPVYAANAKFRVARKSMYVEIIAPLALSTLIQNERGVSRRFVTVLDGGIPALWNVHRVNVDCCPPLKPWENPRASNWLVPHVSLMFSKRERAIREKMSPSFEDTFVNLKDSIHSLLLYAAGVQGPTRSVFVLQNTSTGEILSFIFVTDLRLDIGSHTIFADAWVISGTTIVQEKMMDLEVPGVVTVKIDPDESEAWRYLLPLLVERCRTWTHRPSCEYLTLGTIPLYPDAGADPSKSPFCSCGIGVGTETFPKRFKPLAPYATRAAISPLFAVPFLEEVGMASNVTSDQGRCRACGKQAGSLSLCGKCKSVRYCSKECQVKDWKVHKKNCTK